MIVTRHIHYSPDDWLVLCDFLGFRRVLQSKNLEDAKREALGLVAARCRGVLDALGEAV